MMDFAEIVMRNRSYRRFNEKQAVEKNTLIELIELARLTPSAMNLQPLKYFIFNKREECEIIYPHLHWAGYLKDWAGPEKGERPSAYILVCIDRTIWEKHTDDAGIAAQTIMLGATEKGLGGCIIATFNKKQLSDAFKIADQLEPHFILALGKPIETVVLEPTEKEGSIRYWRDDEEIHHVPKRKLKDIVLNM
jgi:nitroreductase